jgi:hypothetical protein
MSLYRITKHTLTLYGKSSTVNQTIKHHEKKTLLQISQSIDTCFEKNTETHIRTIYISLSYALKLWNEGVITKKVFDNYLTKVDDSFLCLSHFTFPNTHLSKTVELVIVRSPTNAYEYSFYEKKDHLIAVY